MADNVIPIILFLVFAALGLFSCTSMVTQMSACRERGGQPIVDKFYQVACVPKM